MTRHWLADLKASRVWCAGLCAIVGLSFFSGFTSSGGLGEGLAAYSLVTVLFYLLVLSVLGIPQRALPDLGIGLVLVGLVVLVTLGIGSAVMGMACVLALFLALRQLANSHPINRDSRP